MSITLNIKPSTGIAGVIVGSLCAGGVALYKHVKGNTEYKTKELEGEVIEKGCHKNSNANGSLNTIDGNLSGSYSRREDNDYYIQIKMDNGQAITKHGMTYFDNHYVGEKVKVIAKHKYYKGNYRSTEFLVCCGWPT